MPTDWIRPAGLAQALELVRSGGTAVGGGAALLSAALPPRLGTVAVDLAGLVPAGVHDGVIGAGTTLDELAGSPAARRDWPALAEAAGAMATPQVRRVATVGGTVAARLPTSDLFSALAAHDATVLIATDGTATDRDGTDELPVLDYLSAPPAPHLVLGVRPRRSGPGAHRRFALRVGPCPAIAVVSGVRTPEGTVLHAGAVGHTPVPVPFDGAVPPAPALLRDDARASAAYRHRLLAVLGDEVLAAIG